MHDVVIAANAGINFDLRKRGESKWFPYMRERRA
jgi:hypothetical protein